MPSLPAEQSVDPQGQSNCNDNHDAFLRCNHNASPCPALSTIYPLIGLNRSHTKSLPSGPQSVYERAEQSVYLEGAAKHTDRFPL